MEFIKIKEVKFQLIEKYGEASKMKTNPFLATGSKMKL